MEIIHRAKCNPQNSTPILFIESFPAVNLKSTYVCGFTSAYGMPVGVLKMGINKSATSAALSR